VGISHPHLQLFKAVYLSGILVDLVAEAFFVSILQLQAFDALFIVEVTCDGIAKHLFVRVAQSLVGVE
jgi:hypothetical protein